MRGPFRLTFDYTGSEGLTGGGGSPFWNTWPLIFQPTCTEGACNARINFRRFGIIARGTLTRNGATYTGVLFTYGVTTCNGQDSLGKLHVLLRVVDGQLDGSTWLADGVEGRMRYDSTGGACIPAMWTADTAGAPHQSTP